jgi:hypothetical protein
LAVENERSVAGSPALDDNSARRRAWCICGSSG